MTGSAFVSGPNARFLAGHPPPPPSGSHTVRALGVSMLVHIVPLVLIGIVTARLTSERGATSAAEQIASTLVWARDVAGQHGGAEGAAPRERPLSPVNAVPPPSSHPQTEASLTQVPAYEIPVTSMVPELRALPGVMSPISALPSGNGDTPGGGERGGTGTHGAGPGDGNGDTGLGGDGIRGVIGATSPVVLKEVKPGYTSEAMRARIQGKVLVRAVVMPDGSVGAARIVESLDPVFGLDQEALNAVRQWRFNPGRFGGKPVAVPVDIELTFVLR